ncbi:hypothetical protein AB0H88_11405 [Nonomuraea sp. NPDC050680]|uniref:trypsin-like serine peptidase n=1 Tax=Nonomuraea sp. NPDC050680 TaxID=3154630 RepID=UPI0033CFFB2C
MKRILLPAGGAILATGLLAAGLAGTAQATSDVASDPLAKTAAQAAETLDFWSKSNYAALKSAVAFNPDSLEVSKISRGGGYSADTKPGNSLPIGEEKKVAVKSQNVNMPKTIGKVFFEGRDGKLYWCSGTSVQSQYRNLVATAGHCVYDIAGNDEVVSRWVFVPGYYQGKVPYGLYVGKQAFTHYDFDVYEDFDRDYAFVTVYNGIGGTLNTAKKVSKSEYDAYQGDKDVKNSSITEAEYLKCKDLNGGETPDCWAKPSTIEDLAGPDFPGAIKTLKEVSVEQYNAAPTGQVNGGKATNATFTEQVTESQYKAYTGPGYRKIDPKGNFTITHYFVKYWVKKTAKVEYFRTEFFVFGHEVKDVGRLGDNVGGQGVAWNQAPGKVVRTFGYPYGANPDGSKPYTGVTPKWCYGKSDSKVIKVPARKVEEQQSLKCAVTAGYDGGPWLANYSNAKRLGFVTGVTSLIVDVDGNKRYDTITSPIFDGETAAIYKSAAASWSGKLIP